MEHFLTTFLKSSPRRALIPGVLLFNALAAGTAFGDTATINPVADGYKDPGSGALTSTPLKVRNTGTTERAFLKFNLPDAGIPAGSTINSASLKLYMTQAPTRCTGSSSSPSCTTQDRVYNLYPSTNTGWTEATSQDWFTVYPVVPASFTAQTSTGTTVPAERVWTSTGLKTDVSNAIAGALTLIVADNAESGNGYESIFSSREDATADNRPKLVIDYTPPDSGGACASDTPGSVLITQHSYTGPNPLPWGETGQYRLNFTVTAGCQDLTDVKAQGGIASNLVISNALTCTGTEECTSNDSVGFFESKDVGKQNQVFTWTIPSLLKGESATFSVDAFVTFNPAGKMVCDVIKNLTGNWTVSALWDDSGVFRSVSDGPTDKLVVQVSCPL
ncbi:MAG: DNRLRE domain-containing protein [Gammaproteobacteria bacterium]|nr:DNRLRE domain-containing protein [Gammaproteobacteria bacterium]